MSVIIVTKIPEIHTVPLSEIVVNEVKFQIKFDDVNEKSWTIEFKTIFAWRVTAIDYFNIEVLLVKEAFDNGIYHNYILEVQDSLWIKELSKYNPNNGTLSKAHHYLIPLGEQIVEIIAWDNYTLKEVAI